MNKRRILVLNREYFPVIGGAARATRMLAEEWVRQGYMVDLITARVGNTQKKEVLNGVQILRIWTGSNSNLMTLVGAVGYAIVSLVKGILLFPRNQYAAIHSGFLVPAGFSGAILAKLFRVPHEVMPMGGDVYEPHKKLSPHRNFFFRAVVRWVLNNSAVAALSNTLLKDIKRYYSPRVDPVVVQLAFVRPPSVPPAPLIKNAGDHIKIIALGVMLKRKNFDMLIEAFSLIPQKNATLCIVGDGPLRNDLADLVQRLGVADRVSMPGAVSDEEKYRLLFEAHILCMLAAHDGTSLVCQEAMYCGLPIIAANTGGQTDFLIHEQNSLLVDALNPQEIAMALERLINDPALRQTFRSNVQEDVKQFSVDRIAHRHLQIMGLV